MGNGAYAYRPRAGCRPLDTSGDDADLWLGGLPPVIACSWADGKPWRALPWQLGASAEAGEQMPSWLAEAVEHQQYSASKDSKCAFLIQPAPVRAQASVAQSELTEILNAALKPHSGEPTHPICVPCATSPLGLSGCQKFAFTST